MVLDLATDGSGDVQLVSGLKLAIRDGEKKNAGSEWMTGMARWKMWKHVARVDFLYIMFSFMINRSMCFCDSSE